MAGLDRSPFILILCLMLVACAPNTTFQAVTGGTLNSGSDIPDTPVPPTEPPIDYEKLAWEDGTPEREAWSVYTLEQLIVSMPVLIAGASDIKTFCPRYDKATADQRVNFWAMLISGIAKYESSFNPLTRFHETTMGTDPVTQLPVYSEGLLQLSYQDKLWMPGCAFNWEADKNLAPTDSAKTILNPKINLQCGVQILANQISSAKKIVLTSGAYWAVLQSSNSSKKITEISALTKSLTFCN